MKYAKTAGILVGAALAMGAASPAFAAPAGGKSDTFDLLDAKSVTDAKSMLPKKLVDVRALMGATDKVVDKL